MRKGICIICGNEFEYVKGKKITCSIECQKKRAGNYDNLRNKKNRKIKKKKRKKCNLDTTEKEARKIGLSYGMYMAMKRSDEG